MNYSQSDISNILKTIKDIQEDFTCIKCKQVYKKKWCNSDENPCKICIEYLPIRDTYTSILRDIDWQYLKSGETSRREFYNDFLDNLKKWSQKFHIIPTKQDLKAIEELRSVQDWTRNEPDYDYYH
jgi:hypothetical protein